MQYGNRDLEHRIPSVIMQRNHVDYEREFEKRLQVNNMVVDNEVGGRDVAVYLSWEKCGAVSREGHLRRANSFDPVHWNNLLHYIFETSLAESILFPFWLIDGINYSVSLCEVP